MEKLESYSFSFKGRKEKPEEQRQLLYDYSSARDEVRKTFEQFEKEAQNYNFSRIAWGNCERMVLADGMEAE